MDKWEYTIIGEPLSNLLKDEIRLNEYGEDGWELVAVYKGIMYLKRKKPVTEPNKDSVVELAKTDSLI